MKDDNTVWTPGVVTGEALVKGATWKSSDYKSFPSLWRKEYVEATGKEEYRGQCIINNVNHDVWWVEGKFIAQPTL
jgi:hypothetical protein